MPHLTSLPRPAPARLLSPLQSIRNSSRFTADAATADFIFVDMHCYHAAWLAWLHPLNEAGRKAAPSPEFWIRRALTAMQGMKRCVRWPAARAARAGVGLPRLPAARAAAAALAGWLPLLLS